MVEGDPVAVEHEDVCFHAGALAGNSEVHEAQAP
jgi:hypothetical protein